ncbi:MAG: hypothetical protein IKH56_00355 [Oscillospiraceae bacterium]|nr:hypothetical protein [Oscillospiraceae bacterium]
MNEPTVPALQEKEENGVNAEASSAGDQNVGCGGRTGSSAHRRGRTRHPRPGRSG